MLQEETPIPPKSLEDTPLILVDTYDLLVSMINDCKTQKMIAIDLEHHNLRSYQGFTCLIQVCFYTGRMMHQLSTLSTDYIIDCIKIREYVYLMNEITTNPSILKVSPHSFFYDKLGTSWSGYGYCVASKGLWCLHRMSALPSY